MNTATRFVWITVGIFALAASGPSQTTHTKNPQPPASPPAASAPEPAPASAPTPTGPAPIVELADRPLDLKAFGMTMRLPVGSEVEIAGVALDTKASIKSSSDPKKNRWLLQIYASVTREPDLTTAKVLDNIFAQRRTGEAGINPATRKRIQIRQFDRVDNLEINGQRASRGYLDTPELSKNIATGFTVFNPNPGLFIIAQFDCPSGNLEQDRPIIETALATVGFRDQTAENAARAQGLTEAKELLGSLTPERLDAALLSAPILLRVYRPAFPGSTDSEPIELGYQKISIRKGQRGEVNAGRARTSWSVSQREFGYLVDIDARGLILAKDRSIDRVLDSKSISFLSTDLENELCSIINVIKRGSDSDTYVQTIIRNGDRMTVSTEGPSAGGQEPVRHEFSQMPTGYISAVELAMLPSLVVQAYSKDGTRRAAALNFYHFDSATSKLTTRRDEFEPDAGGGAGGWTWTSHPYNAEPNRTVISILDSKGMLMRREADGVVTEPIERDALRALWQNKKLPLGDK